MTILKGYFVTGYVIVLNHVHVLIGFRNTGQSINTIAGNGKHFIAYEIISRLKERGEERLLYKLHLSVEAKNLEHCYSRHEISGNRQKDKTVLFRNHGQSYSLNMANALGYGSNGGAAGFFKIYSTMNKKRFREKSS